MKIRAPRFVKALNEKIGPAPGGECENWGPAQRGPNFHIHLPERGLFFYRGLHTAGPLSIKVFTKRGALIFIYTSAERGPFFHLGPSQSAMP